MRILLGLTSVAGYLSRLKLGLQQQGHDCTYVSRAPDPFGYGGHDDGPWCVRAWRRAALRAEGQGRFPGRIVASVCRRLLAVPVACWAALRFDAIVFESGRSFLGAWDLALFRLLRRRVVMVFHGSDARPPYLNGAMVHTASGPLPPARCRTWTRRTARAVRRSQRWCHAVVLQDECAWFARRPYIDYHWVGIPMDVPAERPPHAGGPLHVVHAPSKAAAKGTGVVRAVMERLRAEGDVVYEELSGLRNAEVRERLARADLVIDQLYSDTPAAGLALEALAGGACVVVGSYHPLVAGPHVVAPPTVRCLPGDLEPCLRDLLKDPARVRRLGAAGPVHVRSHLLPADVAGRMLRVLQDDVPEGVRHRFRDEVRVHGACIEDSALRSYLEWYVAATGVRGLGLAADRAARVLAFAGIR